MIGNDDGPFSNKEEKCFNYITLCCSVFGFLFGFFYTDPPISSRIFMGLGGALFFSCLGVLLFQATYMAIKSSIIAAIQSASEYENLLLRAIFFMWTFIHYLIVHIAGIAILFFCFLIALESV